MQPGEARAANDDGEHQRFGRRDVAARGGAGAGARHARVDRSLDQAVDGRRRARH
jgi:hypothetical protein